MRFEIMEKQATPPAHGNGETRAKSRLPLIIGFAVAVVLVTGVWTGVWLFPQLTPSAVSGFTEVENQALFPRLIARLDRIRSLEIEGRGHRVTLIRTGSTWRLVERDGFPAQPNKADSLIRDIAELRTTFVSAKDDPRYDEYGLDDPSAANSAAVRVTLRNQAEDVLARAIIGHAFSVPDDSGSTKSVFVRRSDDPRVWLADDTLQVDPDPLNWMERQIIDLSADEVRKVVITPPQGEKLVIRRLEGGELRVSQGLSGSENVEGPWVLNAIAGALENLQFLDVQAAEALENSDAPIWHATVGTRNGLSYRFRLVRQDNDVWGMISAAGAGTNGDGAMPADATAEATGSAATSPVVDAKTRRFNARHEEWAYLLPVHAAERLMTRPGDLTIRKETR